MSLLYLARQITDNTLSNQSAAINSLTEQIMSVTMVDKDSGRLFYEGLQSLETLENEEQLIFVQRVTAIFLIWFNAYLQHQRKLIPDEFFNTFEGDIASYFQHRGIVDAWQLIKPGFPPNYVHFVDQSSQLEAQVDYLAKTTVSALPTD